MDIPNIQIVILESPDKKFNTEEGRYYFSNMCNMKIQGYQTKHKPSALPLDTFDFIATHLLICIKGENGKSKILTAYRSLSYQICKKFNISFDILNIIRKYGNAECLKSLEDILDEVDKKGLDILYHSRWTILPEFSKDISLKLLSYELFYTMLFFYQNENKKIEWLSIGANSLNTTKLLYRAGGINVSNLGQPHQKTAFLN